jgi:hypothetical protein
MLRVLVDESPLIANVDVKTPEKNFEMESMSYDWFTRKIKNQSIKNRTVIRSVFPGCFVTKWLTLQGPETWRTSRGTEHKLNLEQSWLMDLLVRSEKTESGNQRLMM